MTPWTAARQASLSFTVSRSLLRLMSIEFVVPSNHLSLCRSLLLPSVFPIIRVFSDESALPIRWPMYSASVLPMTGSISCVEKTPGSPRRWNQSVLKESNPECFLMTYPNFSRLPVLVNENVPVLSMSKLGLRCRTKALPDVKCAVNAEWL